MDLPGSLDVDQGHRPARRGTLATGEKSCLLRYSERAEVTLLVRKLNVRLLLPKEVDRAFPLIRTACPSAELEGWRRFARQRVAAGFEPGTGILLVGNEQDCIVGVAAFRLSDDLLHGRVLCADPFCAHDIVDQANIARALENGLEKIARRHGCTAVHTNVASSGQQGDDGWLSKVLYERGHHLEGLNMCKLIPTVA
jgi:hypothetical protein